jgi:tetratricopeptide (TPR) repeat protein
MAQSGYQRNVKREGAGSALVQVIVVSALVAGTVFVYAKRQGAEKEILDLAVRAKEKTAGDDAPALLAAKAELAKIGEDKILRNNAILSTAAELEAQLFQTYGVADARAKAQQYVGTLKDREVRTAERYAAEAYLMLGEGKTNEAEALLMDLVNDKGVRHAKLLHALSIAKLAQGKAKEAVVAAQEGQKLSTQLVRLPIAEGDALLALGNIPSAANAYLKATKLNPDHLRARTALALTAAVSRQGKPDLLRKGLDALLEEANAQHAHAPPPRVQGFIEYAQGEIYLVENLAKEALAAAEQSIATDPTQPATFALKGRALAKLSKVEEAKKAFDEAMALAPSSLPIAKAAYDVLSRAGKPKDGVAYLEKVQVANPENGMIYVELSLAQAQAGKGKDALQNADAALDKLGNAHDLALFAKGRAMQATGKLDDARTIYGEALSNHLTPDWPELYFAMGLLRLQEKNYDEAVQAFEQAVKFWDKQGGSIDYVADAYENMGKAYDAQGKKKKREAQGAFQKADDLRKGNKA